MSQRRNEAAVSSDPGPPTTGSNGATMEAAGPVCRVCTRGPGGSEGEGPLIVPCSCRGSIGFTHKKCLEEWLHQRDTDQCDVCMHRFTLRRRPPPLWRFFRNPDHRTDIVRMAVNVASCLGDVMVLVFAWIYASGFLGSVGWLTYLFIVAVLLFQTVFWITVEVIRAMTCSEPVRKWRKRTASIELLLDDGEGTHSTQRLEKSPSLLPLAYPAIHSPTLLVSSPKRGKEAATPDRVSTKRTPLTSARGSISADNAVRGAPREETRPLRNTL
ncbi:E3 ubiquitin-protein ligase MARCHF2-like [Amblyomma americanum]